MSCNDGPPGPACETEPGPSPAPTHATPRERAPHRARIPTHIAKVRRIVKNKRRTLLIGRHPGRRSRAGIAGRVKRRLTSPGRERSTRVSAAGEGCALSGETCNPSPGPDGPTSPSRRGDDPAPFSSCDPGFCCAAPGGRGIQRRLFLLPRWKQRKPALERGFRG